MLATASGPFVGHKLDQDDFSLCNEDLNRGAGKVYMKKTSIEVS